MKLRNYVLNKNRVFFKQYPYILWILLIIAGIFIIHAQKVSIFQYLGANWGICPEEPAIFNLPDIEEIVPSDQFEFHLFPLQSEAILIKEYLNEGPFILSKKKLEYIFLKTVEDQEGGVTNYGEVEVNTKIDVFQGYYYKYPLKRILESRNYSQNIRIKFINYLPDSLGRKKRMKLYGQKVTLISRIINPHESRSI